MKHIKEYPSQETLRELFNYSDEEGRLYWKVRPANNVDISKAAGCIGKDGYIEIKICRSAYKLHRLVYIWHFGSIEKKDVVDHISGDNTDNRINNLQAISNQKNIMKQRGRSDNTSGYRGVCWSERDNKWLAHIRFDNHRIHVGYIENIEDAAIAYDHAAIELFGSRFAQTNFPVQSYGDEYWFCPENDRLHAA